ncbi:MAG: tryptophan synthase subunit alpha, partial [Elusimicrobiota bacterium]
MKKNRLLKKIDEIKISKGKILVFFLTAGFPNLRTTEKVISSLEKGGAEVIELGVPFSDPIADGPAIQWSSQKALLSGITLAKILKFVKNIRGKIKIPIVLMSYFNPVYRFGIRKFFKTAVKNGIDALLLTDVIPEEAAFIKTLSVKMDLPLIFLITTTTSSSRYLKIINSTRGFLYVVSLTGVTGERKKISTDIFP